MILRNESSNTVDIRLHGIGRLVVKPGETTPDIDDAYCLPRKGENPLVSLPPIIELLAPQLKPVDKREVEVKAQEIENVRVQVRKSGVPEYEELVRAGMPPARALKKVAAAQAKKQLDEPPTGDE
jgi:hypothetical protein